MEILVNIGDGDCCFFQQLLLLLVQVERKGGDVLVRLPAPLEVLSELLYLACVQTDPRVKIGDVVRWLDRLV